MECLVITKLFPLFWYFSLAKKKWDYTADIIKARTIALKWNVFRIEHESQRVLPPHLNFSSLETHHRVNWDPIPKENKTADLYFQSSFLQLVKKI